MTNFRSHWSGCTPATVCPTAARCSRRNACAAAADLPAAPQRADIHLVRSQPRLVSRPSAPPHTALVEPGVAERPTKLLRVAATHDFPEVTRRRFGEGGPIKVAFTSSKSRTCDDVPLISAACRGLTLMPWPNAQAPSSTAVGASVCNRMRGAGSWLPATVTPSQSSMHSRAMAITSSGSWSKLNAAERVAKSTVSPLTSVRTFRSTRRERPRVRPSACAALWLR